MNKTVFHFSIVDIGERGVGTSSIAGLCSKVHNGSPTVMFSVHSSSWIWEATRQVLGFVELASVERKTTNPSAT